jgi:hypothetical protein
MSGMMGSYQPQTALHGYAPNTMQMPQYVGQQNMAQAMAQAQHNRMQGMMGSQGNWHQYYGPQGMAQFGKLGQASGRPGGLDPVKGHVGTIVNMPGMPAYANPRNDAYGVTPGLDYGSAVQQNTQDQRDKLGAALGNGGNSALAGYMMG